MELRHIWPEHHFIKMVYVTHAWWRQTQSSAISLQPFSRMLRSVIGGIATPHLSPAFAIASSARGWLRAMPPSLTLTHSGPRILREVKKG